MSGKLSRRHFVRAGITTLGGVVVCHYRILSGAGEAMAVGSPSALTKEIEMKQSSRYLAFCLILSAVGLSSPSLAADPSQEIFAAGSQKSFKGPENLFTGDVQVDMLFPANETAHYSGAYVTFQPGARTAWHLHPAGQHMVVTSGVGLTGTRDGNIVTIKAGDAVWCPPDIDHWHGATPDSPMTHLVLTGDLDGKNVIWKEKVSDDQYLRK